MPRYDVALLDASVLIPMPIRGTPLRSAEAGLFTPRWSADILDESERNLRSWIGEESARRRLAAMQAAFPRALVTAYDHLIEAMTNHPKDRHALAAAVASDAGLIVTANLRDFPHRALEADGIFAWSPDTFLGDLLRRHSTRLIEVVRAQARGLRNPPVTMAELLGDLAIDAPEFACQVESALS